MTVIMLGLLADERDLLGLKLFVMHRITKSTAAFAPTSGILIRHIATLSSFLSRFVTQRAHATSISLLLLADASKLVHLYVLIQLSGRFSSATSFAARIASFDTCWHRCSKYLLS